MAGSSLRRDFVTRPIYHMAKGVLPEMSDTEAEAIAAGDVWWDAALFTGDPDWSQFLDIPPAKLTPEERAFIDGPVEQLCAMLDDWKITWEERDLPAEAWDFIKRERFFGMIIPKEFGGLGFTPYAHSEVVRKISTRSVTAAVTVMVPNSLGPGELLLQFGTDEQKQHWLPRLADGREIPAFGLTSPEAGSDAAAMTDTGVVCEEERDGRKVLGLRLNWHKRYITLGPICTVLGLAVKVKDPEGLLGGGEDLGITVVLVPTDTKGVEIGRRHLPSMQAFQNGPNWGNDVFVPLDAILGGREQIGKGWMMLNAALAAGRGISLPSLSAAGAAMAARTTGAYARVRTQFRIPIGEFEGVQERLARIAANAYQLDAARRFTCAGLALGHHPSVVSAIMKNGATERMRIAANDAMDVHAGKAVIDGPKNYMGNFYRSVPVGITVEGANILTRSLIVFGQGAIRAHPFILKEMEALADEDTKRGLEAFDVAVWAHAGHILRTAKNAFVRSWSDGMLGPAPETGPTRRYYRKLSRYAASFALASDAALLTIGGSLKRREMLSARFGDILSELYMLCAVLKRWEEDGRQEADLPLVEWIMQDGFLTIERRMKEILDNFPSRPVAWLLQIFVLPFGVVRRGPSDRVTRQCARLIMEPSATRDRLTEDVYIGGGDDAVAELERALELVVETQPIRDRLKKLRIRDPKDAWDQGLISKADHERLLEADAAVAKVVAVDDFSPEELTGRAIPAGRAHAEAAE
ncbi:MAG: acyl-CoA dehydrogenase [Phenylobacterium sp.]|uniref:acyl-CoA dehydrogenase n=3 Tax=Phenylobacterium sp. TaxID=1871053 RepID=UPI0018122538|nr:acyl-CoA dehydrogenase [Phenylobacterium sp.]MBA4795325.1 acyl-CoA dehydrogenase [Phenylobacterium sp.]